ncbi:Hypothetical predicted protein [Pelobates cultripes]|uniref:Uncharacterized protein n=1 Tax=Pelobates cultripes TaxID=61616 RepID=A0AAD1RQ83_PELCU|nr:Hypothetical predicted protein [Pelobates cultripes]
MGMPGVSGYYRAVQITPLLSTSYRKDPMAWATLEKKHARGLSLPLMAWLPKWNRPKNSELLPTTALTLSTWDKYRKRLGQTALLSPAFPLDTHTRLRLQTLT